MSITDELREWMKGSTLSSWTAEHLTAIVDRIDAEHQKALDEWKAEHGKMWLKGYAECHAELLEGNETLASDLERCGWIRLPKDADGEYIRIGDVMEWVRYEDDDPTIVRTVSGIGNGVFFAWSDEQGRYAQYEANAYRHYHALTVEDVLFDSLKHFGAVEERTPEVDKWLHEQDYEAQYSRRRATGCGEVGRRER